MHFPEKGFCADKMKTNIRCIDLLLTGAIGAGIALVIHHEIRKKQAQKFIRDLQTRANTEPNAPTAKSDSVTPNENSENRGDEG